MVIAPLAALVFPLLWWTPVASGAKFHFGVGVGLRPGGMGDPQLYWDAPTATYHIQPQYSPVAAVAPRNSTACKPKGADGWGHATSSDLIGDFAELPSTLVNGDTTTGWETTNNYAAVVDSTQDPALKVWTQRSHGIEGNHSRGE
eukprot:gene21697-20552_t